jgi:hypothetical protein
LSLTPPFSWAPWHVSHFLVTSSGLPDDSTSDPNNPSGQGNPTATGSLVSAAADGWNATPFIKVASSARGPMLSPAIQVASSGPVSTTPAPLASPSITLSSSTLSGPAWSWAGQSTGGIGSQGNFPLHAAPALVGLIHPALATAQQTSGVENTARPFIVTSAGTSVASWPTGFQGTAWSRGSIGQDLPSDEQATAQVIPTASRFAIFGALNSAVPFRIFALLPGDPRLRDVGIEVSPATASDPGVEVAVYDASGNTLADTVPAPGPEPRSVAVNFAMDQATPASGVYVKIAAPPGTFDASSSAAPAVSDGFILQVTRGPEPVAPSTLSFYQGLIPPAYLGTGSISPSVLVSQSELDSTLQPLPGSTADGPAEAVLGALPSISATPAGGQSLPTPSVAIGPLPQRAGAPLGGVLAEGDPVPQLDRHDPALVDLALIGLPEAAPNPGAGEADLEAIAAELDGAPDARQGPGPLRGASGLPLVTASLQGDRTLDAEALLAALPPVGAAPAAVTTAGTASSAPSSARMAATKAPGARRIAPASLISGLSVAMTTIFSLVLPDMSRLMTPPREARFRLCRLRFPFRLRLRPHRRDAPRGA